MPELPEVETIKRGIEAFAQSARILDVIVRNGNLRIPIPDNFKDQIILSKILTFARKAKYIIINLDNGNSIIIHLGMSGKIKTCLSLPESLEKHDHVIIKTSSGYLIYNDPRRFGLMDVTSTKQLDSFPLFKNIGIDPFDKKLTAEFLFGRLQNKNCDIKSILLDQKIIAGIGNIYASEILFAAQISPLRKAKDISKQECGVIIKKIRSVLKLAIDNGGSTLHDYQRPDGSLGYFQNLHSVYNKAGQRCPGCICQQNPCGGIQKIIQHGRSTFFCPVKQK